MRNAFAFNTEPCFMPDAAPSPAVCGRGGSLGYNVITYYKKYPLALLKVAFCQFARLIPYFRGDIEANPVLEIRPDKIGIQV
jgi:hypothetical protein